MFFLRRNVQMPTPEAAPKGRSAPIDTAFSHYILGTPLHPPFPDGVETVIFGMGCFWGAERLFWQLGDGVHTTAVGYAAGYTPNPTYDEVCSGRTGHNEVVLVAYEPLVLSFNALLKAFWEGHNPTQGMRQGNDVGTQYRSGIYTTTPMQDASARSSKAAFQSVLTAKGFGAITTEILSAPEFYYAEAYHQQYLAKVPHGYCGLGGTGVSCPIGAGVSTSPRTPPA